MTWDHPESSGVVLVGEVLDHGPAMAKGLAMTESGTLPRIVRFGVFEFDLGTGELRKHGLRIKLHGQPIDLLAMLIGRHVRGLRAQPKRGD